MECAENMEQTIKNYQSILKHIKNIHPTLPNDEQREIALKLLDIVNNKNNSLVIAGQIKDACLEIRDTRVTLVRHIEKNNKS